MGRIESTADLRDTLSPKIKEAAQNVKSAAGEIRDDFSQMADSTEDSFDGMSTAILTGQLAADLFRETIQMGVQVVRDSIKAYEDHNRQLRDAGFAYDTMVDRQDQLNKQMRDGQIVVGGYLSHWKELVGAMLQGVNAGAALQVMIGNVETTRALVRGSMQSSDDIQSFVPGSKFEEKLPGAMSVFDADAFGLAKAKQALAEEERARLSAERAAEKERREAEQELNSATRERARQERERIRENNAAVRSQINASLHRFRGRSDFSGREIDPSDPEGSNASAFVAPGDGSRDGEFGAFSPITPAYMKSLTDAQQRALREAQMWGNLWRSSISGTLQAALFDTQNFGRDFVSILSNIFKQILEQKLIGDISASGGPVGRFISGLFNLGEDRSQVEGIAGELQRMQARGKL